MCTHVCVRFSRLLCVDRTRGWGCGEREREEEEGGKVSEADGRRDGRREGGEEGWSIASVSRQQKQREAGIHPLSIHSFMSTSNPLFLLCCFSSSHLSRSLPELEEEEEEEEGRRGGEEKHCDTAGTD